MPKMISLTIDGKEVSVPEGTLIVNAAKQIGNDIPVFCYHPKMEPVGMCRMCLVDVGRPMIDRATGQPVLDENGKPKIGFGPKLETACTTPVSMGMVVATASDKVKAARKDVLEFLLTSHPLDCPICDKGGECPLQNLTLGYGPGTSRFALDEKMHLNKHFPLGELIYLDRERCIQCGRCVRFQHDVVDDPVINFYNRGRSLEIQTYSEPGFDSIWSGNTTDICPVGALTTVDFHFGARPWELNSAASVCNQCPVGCNIVYNVRREAKSGGKMAIKRVMPRQNEAVNEIWICDKGRFSYHYTESAERLSEPLVRKDGKLQPASWDEALTLVAEKLQAAGANALVLAGGRLPNEDLFNLRKMAQAAGGQAALYTYMAGGDLTAQVGVSAGTNLGDLGKGSAIVVVSSDLHEEAPVWWLRIKQAAQRGATLIVVGARPTRLEQYAAHVVRCAYGEEVAAVRGLGAGESDAAKALTAAENVILLYGSDGLSLSGSAAVARACAELLLQGGHVGKANNGLLGVWHSANLQGAWDLGWRPVDDLAANLSQAKAVVVAAADPAGDDPRLAAAFKQAAFKVVHELFLTETAKLADVVLPVLAVTEREGTFTSGERRVQRFNPAVKALAGARADFAIAAEVAGRLNMKLEGWAVALVLLQAAAEVPAYAGMNYQKLADTHEQWPIVGRKDLYYGGTTYANDQGLGVQASNAAQRGETPDLGAALNAPAPLEVGKGQLLLVAVTRLYDQGRTLAPSALLSARLARAEVRLNPVSAAALGLQDGAEARLGLAGGEALAKVVVDESVPAGLGLIPRSVGLALDGSAAALVSSKAD